MNWFRRRDLREAEVITIDTHTAWKKTLQLLEIIGIVVCPTLILHTGTYCIAVRRNWSISKYMRGVLGVPGFFLLTSFLVANPVLSTAASLCSIGYITGYVGCTGFLIALPLPLLGLSVYVIRHYVQDEMVTYKSVRYSSAMSKVSNNLYGHWSNTHVTDKYSIFFEHLKGFSVNNSIVVNVLRIYHVPIKLLKNLVMAFVSTLVVNHLYNSITLLIITVMYTVLLFTTKPLNGFRQQVCESLGELISTCTYSVSLAIIIMRAHHNTKRLNHAYAATVTANMAVTVFSQAWSVVFILIHLAHAQLRKMRVAGTGNAQKDAANNIKTEVIENSDDINTDDLAGVF